MTDEAIFIEETTASVSVEATTEAFLVEDGTYGVLVEVDGQSTCVEPDEVSVFVESGAAVPGPAFQNLFFFTTEFPIVLHEALGVQKEQYADPDIIELWMNTDDGI